MEHSVKIMGIVNLTDNSYYAASRCLDENSDVMTDKALERIGKMLDEGADIIDIGACSTRPGSEAVGETEEWRRLEPVLRALREKFPECMVSVDTYWASVVAKTAELFGNDAVKYFIVNDISAGEDDPEMLPLVGHLGLRYIAMHKRGNPKTMQSLCDYDDVTAEVIRYFHEFADRANSYGIKDWILDPGFGFAKTVDQNYRLLAELYRFAEENFSGTSPEILVGVSRKSMIYRLFDITPEEALPATQVLHFKALQSGASILRVHDVAEAVRTRTLFSKI